jgi:hypothetical protein
MTRLKNLTYTRKIEKKLILEGITKKGYNDYKNAIVRLLFRIFSDHFIYFTKYFRVMETQTAIVLFALVAALGLVTVIAVDIILTAQESEAAKSPTGQCASTFKSRNGSLCRFL